MTNPTRHISVSDLRKYNAAGLRRLNEESATAIIHNGPKPIAVMISYDLFMKMQSLRLEAEKHARRGVDGSV